MWGVQEEFMIMHIQLCNEYTLLGTKKTQIHAQNKIKALIKYSHTKGMHSHHTYNETHQGWYDPRIPLPQHAQFQGLKQTKTCHDYKSLLNALEIIAGLVKHPPRTSKPHRAFAPSTNSKNNQLLLEINRKSLWSSISGCQFMFHYHIYIFNMYESY